MKKASADYLLRIQETERKEKLAAYLCQMIFVAGFLIIATLLLGKPLRSAVSQFQAEASHAQVSSRASATAR